MTILYAVNDEDADARIEKLIAAHSAPKTLTVVSSDNRIRQAATRRKARVLTADLFLVDIETRKRSPREAPAPPKPEKGRGRELSSSESAYWLNEFRDIEEMPETRAMMGNEMGLPTDAEIAEIEREVEREFREGK